MGQSYGNFLIGTYPYSLSEEPFLASSSLLQGDPVQRSFFDNAISPFRSEQNEGTLSYKIYTIPATTDPFPITLTEGQNELTPDYTFTPPKPKFRPRVYIPSEMSFVAAVPSPLETKKPDNKTLFKALQKASTKQKLAVLREIAQNAAKNIKNAKSNTVIVENLKKVMEFGNLLRLDGNDKGTKEALGPVLDVLGNSQIQKKMAGEQANYIRAQENYLKKGILSKSPAGNFGAMVGGSMGKMRDRWNNYLKNIVAPYFKRINKNRFQGKPIQFLQAFNGMQNETGYMTRDLEKFSQKINENRGIMKGVITAGASLPLIPLGAGAFIIGGAAVTGTISAGSGSSGKEVAADVAAHVIGSSVSMGLLKVGSPALRAVLPKAIANPLAGATSEGVGNILDHQTRKGILKGELLTKEEAIASGGFGALFGAIGNLRGQGPDAPKGKVKTDAPSVPKSGAAKVAPKVKESLIKRILNKLSINRSKNPVVSVDAGTAAKEAIADLPTDVQKKILDQEVVIVSNTGVGNAGKDNFILKSSGKVDKPIKTTLREIIDHPEKFPDLDLGNVLHEVKGHRGFDEFVDAQLNQLSKSNNVDDTLEALNRRGDLARIEKETKLATEKNLHTQASDASDIVKKQAQEAYENTPPELAAELISSTGTLKELDNQLSKAKKVGNTAEAERIQKDMEQLIRHQELLVDALNSNKVPAWYRQSLIDYLETLGVKP